MKTRSARLAVSFLVLLFATTALGAGCVAQADSEETDGVASLMNTGPTLSPQGVVCDYCICRCGNGQLYSSNPNPTHANSPPPANNEYNEGVKSDAACKAENGVSCGGWTIYGYPVSSNNVLSDCAVKSLPAKNGKDCI